MKQLRDIKNWQEMINEPICGDAIELMKKLPDKSVDLVLTDPPYPDYHQEIYKYKKGLLNGLKRFSCKQFIFWSSKVDFPLSYTAIHIWDKKVGVGSWYERIFERNGAIEYKVYRYYLINSSVAANYTHDNFWGHSSQKPIQLIEKLILENSNKGDLILDPFMGSFTTAIAAESLERRWIGCDISEKYCQIGEERLKILRSQPKLFTP